jgi:hypothetical protein
MSTQSIGTGRRPRMLTAFIALALAAAVLVVAAQASSIWSSRTVAPTHPAPRSLPVGTTNVALGHLPAGCRPKYGCDHTGSKP